MTQEPPIYCAGSALWDIIARTERALKPGHDVPGRITRQLGGVALNVALALSTRGRSSGVLSAVGRDPSGDRLITSAIGAGIDCSNVTRIDDPTDSYLAVEDARGEVFVAVADCASLERAGDDVLAPLRDGRLGAEDAPYQGRLVIDGNFAQDLLNSLLHDPCLRAAKLALVPASPGKATWLSRIMTHPGATLYVNRIEAEILCSAKFDTALQAADALRHAGAAEVVVTDSHRAAASAGPGHSATHTPPQITARTTTGAGDAFLAAHLDHIDRASDPQTALAEAVTAAAAHVSGGEFDRG